MKNILLYITINLISLLTTTTQAQSLGNMPSSLNWQKLDGDAVNLITTPQTIGFARRALAIDKALLKLKPISLGNRVERIDVVVQPTTVVPNGFVGLFPYRSFLFGTAPQSQDLLSSNDWATVLSIHEYRHVEQYNNLNRGVTKLADFVFGDGGRGVFQSLSTPTWFFEGDATYYETALTYSGRGRSPQFTALQRALALQGVQYSYLKARNGSFRSRVPNRYPLGLAMTSHGRHAYADPWPEVVAAAGKYAPPILPFSSALKRATGMHTPAFYRETYDSLATLWNGVVKTLDLTYYTQLTRPSKQIARYESPLPESNSENVIALRSAQNRIRQIVQIRPDGKEKVLANYGPNVDGSLNQAAGKIVWTSVQAKPTRIGETYSVVKLYEPTTGKVRQISKASKYFSPGLNPEATEVVCAQIPSGATLHAAQAPRPQLVFIDLQTGKHRISAPLPYDLISYPRYTPDGKSIVAIVKRRGTINFAVFDVELQAPVRYLLDWTRHSLSQPFIHDGQVYFSASYTGIENIFRVDLSGNKEVQQLTEVAIAASTPSTDGEVLYFTTTEVSGDPIGMLAREDWLMRPLSYVEPVDLPQYAHMELGGAAKTFRDKFMHRDPSVQARDEVDNLSIDFSSSPNLKPYNGLFRGFSVYSLQPLADQNRASLTVNAGNVLADIDATLTAGYNLKERRGYGGAQVTIARTFPWISADFGLAERRYLRLEDANSERPRFQNARFEQRRVGVSVFAPLSQNYGAYRLSSSLLAGVRHYTTGDDEGQFRRPTPSSLTSVRGGFSISHLRSQAAKQILPRFGVSLDVATEFAPGTVEAGQTTGALNVYLPGLVRSHGVQLTGSFRHERIENSFQFSDFYRYARGTNKSIHNTAFGLAANYHFPLAYPDIGIPILVYVSRIRANAWFDATRYEINKSIIREGDDLVLSTGLDLVFDATFFNVQSLPIGVRFPYIITGDVFGLTADGLASPQLLVNLNF